MLAISYRINTLLLVLLVLMAGAIITMLATRAYGGPLDPPSAPASTPGGIDGRIPIDHLPFTISASGSYVVTRDLEVSAGDGITVNADDVTIDLNGFTLDGVSKTAAGISARTRSNLSVSNGVIRRWSSGVLNDMAPGGLIRHLQVTDNFGGVLLGSGATVDASAVRSNSDGVTMYGGGATVKDSTFYGNSLAAIGFPNGNGLIDSNNIDIPAGGTGVVAGDFTTIRRNYFGNLALSGYVTIALGTHSFVAATENRMKAGLTTGGSGTGNGIPYDFANAVTNFSP